MKTRLLWLVWPLMISATVWGAEKSPSPFAIRGALPWHNFLLLDEVGRDLERRISSKSAGCAKRPNRQPWRMNSQN